MDRYQEKFLRQLSKEYPNLQSASTELINLNAILNLPKGTEHFIADIHGEYDAFNHVLKNASGILKQKIDQHFDDLDDTNKKRLAFFIYYPHVMINKYKKAWGEEGLNVLLKDVLRRMIVIARIIASKYTKSHIRKNLNPEFAYITSELLYESSKHEDKERYYEAIMKAIFETGRDKKMVIELSRFIRRIAIDRLHIVGDIFDRGEKPHLVMEKIMQQKYVDIQWGNHDILWMGAASGCMVSIANLIRIAARYSNLECLEDGYGINLRYLSALANKAYKKDPCQGFYPKINNDHPGLLNAPKFVARMHKAIAIIQFKLEKAIIERNPNFQLESRLLLDKIDYDKGTITIANETYPLKETTFPTIDPNDPYTLTAEEDKVIRHLRQLFMHNDKLQSHIRFLFRKGRMLEKSNNRLLFHAGIPMHEDGTFKTFTFHNKDYQGPSLFEILDQTARTAYLTRHENNNHDKDIFMMLWQSPLSPLFCKNQMRTFERYFIADKTAHQEIMDPYFTLRKDKDILDAIFKAFGIDPAQGKIINGHTPLDFTKGDDVVLNDKRIYLIDGGMSKQYIGKTNLGGTTLISDSYAYYLVGHSRFDSYETLIEKEEDIITLTHSEDLAQRRQFIYDTDKGQAIQETIDDLKHLIAAYKQGLLKEED